MMTPEDYLRQYAESLQLSKLSKDESGPAFDGIHLMAERGYYYPPYLQQEAYLDMLSRADLLGVMQQILATEYPQQRLIRRQVGEYLEALQRLKQERDWRRMEMERLESELSLRIDQIANLGDEISRIGAERERLDTLVIDIRAELENCRSRIAILENEYATLHAAQADLKPVMNLQSAVIALRDVARGASVGYGGSWCAPRDSRIATVTIGYGDGYPRHAPSGTPVLINGQRAALVGRVSMDMITVDVTDLPGVQIGDEVILWGEQLSVNEVAHCAGTIGYELLTRMPERIPRIYRGQ